MKVKLKASQCDAAKKPSVAGTVPRKFNIMKIKSTKGKSSLLPQDIYDGVLKEFGLEPKGSENPEKGVFTFEVTGKDGKQYKVQKVCPANLDPDSAMRTVIQALLVRPLSDSEIEEGFDPESLVNTKCRLMVVHRNGAGGRLQLAVDAIYAIEASATN